MDKAKTVKESFFHGISILLCTYNGERFLHEQLSSIEAQTRKDWRILVSDDGSSDSTLKILHDFGKKVGPDKIKIRLGPQKGFVVNFLTLACSEDIASKAYAFCDQDDIWVADKLDRAMRWLEKENGGQPAYYCSRTSLVDENGQYYGLSPLFSKPPSLGNALVQNLAGGNTIVFNEAARKLLIKAGGPLDVPSHDWWLYILTTGMGGRIKYDPRPSVAYRQHGVNLIGSNLGLIPKLKRLYFLFQGRLHNWTERHETFLAEIQKNFPPANRQICEEFFKARNSSLLPRVKGLIRCGVRRQKILDTLGLYLAAILGKI